jgi:hypothetical protein
LTARFAVAGKAASDRARPARLRLLAERSRGLRTVERKPRLRL